MYTQDVSKYVHKVHISLANANQKHLYTWKNKRIILLIIYNIMLFVINTSLY